MKNLTTEARHEEEGRSYQGAGFSRAVMSKRLWALATELVRNTTRTFRAILREIFDESAYDRFLLRTQRQRSVESYRVFMMERDAAAVTRPRCC